MQYAIAYLNSDPSLPDRPAIEGVYDCADEAISMAEVCDKQHATPFQVEDGMDPENVSWAYVTQNQIEFAVAYADTPLDTTPTLQIHLRSNAELVNAALQLSEAKKFKIKTFSWVPNMELGHRFTWDEVEKRSLEQTA